MTMLASLQSSDEESAPADVSRPVASDLYAHWPVAFADELRHGEVTGRVGGALVSENEALRVWQIHLRPGERLPFHRHVLDYFWTAVSPGRAASYYADGTVREFEYRLGDTAHFTFEAGDDMVHNLVNVGTTTLSFVTVESKHGANQPLPVGEIAARA